MLFSCISLGINSGYAENIKRESLSSQDDIQIVNNIKALNERLKASGKKSLEEYFDIINQKSENSKIQHEKPDILDPSKFIPISSVDFSNGDPYEKINFTDKEYYHFAKDQDLKELMLLSVIKSKTLLMENLVMFRIHNSGKILSLRMD